MEEKRIVIEGIPLRFLDNNKQDSPIIFFLHSNSGTANTWYKQWNDPLFDRYRIIAFDMPGCGGSQIPPGIAWDHSLPASGRVMAAATRQLAGTHPYAFVGISYGSNIVAEIMGYGPAPAAIALLSSCVTGPGFELDKIFLPGDSVFFHDLPEKETVDNFFRANIKNGNAEDVQAYANDFFRAAPRFRSGLIRSVMEGKISDEIAFLRNWNKPLLLAFGEEDQVINNTYLDDSPFTIWKKIEKVPGAGHFLHTERPDIVNRLLADYLQTML